MKHLLRLLLSLPLVLLPHAAYAQLDPVILEAEGGTRGSEFGVAADGTTTYATVLTTGGGDNPGSAARVITFNVTFPHAGVWELYARPRSRRAEWLYRCAGEHGEREGWRGSARRSCRRPARDPGWRRRSPAVRSPCLRWGRASALPNSQP